MMRPLIPLLPFLPLTLSHSTPLPTWSLHSSTHLPTDPLTLSSPTFNTSTWPTLSSRGTLMSSLLHSGLLTESSLFYSKNLAKVDSAQFRVPWWYRWQGVLDFADDGRSKGGKVWYTLQTHGISSRADVWVNGVEVLGRDVQAGAYTGVEVDVTGVWKGKGDVVLVRVWPTEYDKDFGLGFVDWNPSPPDNGTGIWRDVEIKTTGQVSLSTLRVTTDAALDGSVEIYVDVKNLDSKAKASGSIECAVYNPSGAKIATPKSGFDLADGKQSQIKLKVKVKSPQLWWPKQWGDQPLYTAQCNATTTHGLSDETPSTKFGIRTVTSKLDPKHNDTTFFINNQRFQVLGAGYTSDIFLRFDETKLRAQFQYVLDMGLNTIRLEGKQEHPFLYSLASELGLMILAGWECCDKWEGWTYNEDGSGEKWSAADYSIANHSMRHEAALMQHHPSVLGFLLGSDYWPDDRATHIYTEALSAFNWATPALASASQRGAPATLGNGGMKMDGPYDWVPPHYWYDAKLRLGSAAGFASELGAGVGTPELGSLRKFLSEDDLADLWVKDADAKPLYHMATNASVFATRGVYNAALRARYGAPKGLADYVLKAQMADYEAVRAQFEAYVSRWSVERVRPATGVVYWMLNNAWPSLHWNLFDYYLHPGGSYFGAKTALGKGQGAVFDYGDRGVYVYDRRVRANSGKRSVDVEVIDLEGKVLVEKRVETDMTFNSAHKITTVPGLKNSTSVVLLRLRLSQGSELLSRAVYWLAPTLDTLDWDNSTWYHTPVTKYSDFTSLNTMATADLSVSSQGASTLLLENKGKVPAVFIRLNLVDGKGKDVVPVVWSENYITLWPGEKMNIEVTYAGGNGGVRVEVDGRNVRGVSVPLKGGF